MASASGTLPESTKNNDFSKENFTLKDVELIRTVGTGTFGRVMAIRHKPTDRFYALKILSIDQVIKLKQVEHVKNEKTILFKVDHPFLVKLYWTNHDVKFLYMLFDYVCGGELFTYLRNRTKFPSATAKFYAAEIISVLSYLHSKQIIYRDLKPENILLDQSGHLKVTDFGFAKIVKDRTYTLCGTPEYLAPEVLQAKGYNKAVDWWALGIFIYEMLFGFPPFLTDNALETYQKILNNEYTFPKETVDLQGKDLIRRLLVTDTTRRLGNMRGGSNDVLKHLWFANINWDDVTARKLKPPIIPEVSGCGDTLCYDRYDELDWKKVSEAAAAGQDTFKDF